ncbi:hypothetical protein GIB67_030849 [Kingdonia uniflora]|uniref:Uncharacterized protein n=1 Tax=Kingdonia uniflora TaxID=39325 RepID=A0A7J7L390_9MAGN|nr:hypothetical protein GIB67_030849 [Kingdonia uniflora]
MFNEKNTTGNVSPRQSNIENLGFDVESDTMSRTNGAYRAQKVLGYIYVSWFWGKVLGLIAGGNIFIRLFGAQVLHRSHKVGFMFVKESMGTTMMVLIQMTVDQGVMKSMVKTNLFLANKTALSPNVYSSHINLTWLLVSYKWGNQMPAIIARSISILSDAGLGMANSVLWDYEVSSYTSTRVTLSHLAIDAGLGMAILSLGMFMVLQLCIIASGNKLVGFTIYHGFLRFLVGLAVIALASITVGL